MNMSKASDFNKIKSFVQDQLEKDSSALMIRPLSNGFKVNNYLIRQVGDCWQVLSKQGDILHRFFSRKYAVLSALLMAKKKLNEIENLRYLDQQLAIALQDHHHYMRLSQKNEDSLSESIYSARLSRAQQIMEGVRMQVNGLEKSLHLL
jgi:hypothetical protein